MQAVAPTTLSRASARAGGCPILRLWAKGEGRNNDPTTHGPYKSLRTPTPSPTHRYAMNGAPKLTSALLLAALVWLFSASGTFGQPIDPFIYLREHYDYLAVILNPHPEWGDIVGADGSADGEEYAVLYDRGNIEFYEEGTNRPLRVITTRGRTGVTLIPHCEPGCIAVSDDSGIDFYDAEGNWILRREVQGGPLPGLGIIDIDYDTQWNRLVVCTESVIGWLRDDNRLEVLHQSGGFKGVEVIDMESDPLTYDMLQREHYFNKFDLAGQISDPRTFRAG